MKDGAHGAPQTKIASALEEGLVVVDRSGRILWMNRQARQRINGELKRLALPLSKPEAGSLDCFLTPLNMMIGGQRVTIAVIQEATPKEESSGEVLRDQEGLNLLVALETVLADSTSWFARTVLERLKALGGPGRDAGEPAALRSLTEREREVLGLICEGRSDTQMATILGLSENTVRNHIASLYRKIGVNRRTAAVIWARERGIRGCDGLGLDPQRRRGSAVNNDSKAHVRGIAKRNEHGLPY